MPKAFRFPAIWTPVAREAIDNRRIPTHRLIARLDLAQFDGLHAHTCIELKPETVYVPFSQHIGKPAVAAKKVGDRVVKGEVLAAAAEGLSTNIHASMDGVIVAIDEKGARISGKEV